MNRFLEHHDSSIRFVYSFTEQQRLSYFHELFMSQVEYCTNVVFHRRLSRRLVTQGSR